MPNMFTHPSYPVLPYFCLVPDIDGQNLCFPFNTPNNTSFKQIFGQAHLNLIELCDHINYGDYGKIWKKYFFVSVFSLICSNVLEKFEQNLVNNLIF